MPTQLPKVFVVSFDGGTWTNLRPLAESGIMPNLKRLLDKGLHANLESTIPPVTPPAWTAFMTGCNPGKSGVFDFYEYQENPYKITLTTNKSIQVDTLWKLLSNNGLRVGVIDVPINYPPPPVNGYVISGWERPSNKKVFTFPPDLGPKLLEKLGDYPICLTTFDRQGTKDSDFISSLIQITSKVAEAGLWLLENESVDFFMIHFQTTDIIQHSFWHEINTFDFESKNPVLIEIWKFYKNLDEKLGLLTSKVNDSTTFFLVSDHGFGPVKRRMALNFWLKQNGYLKLKQDIGSQIRTNLQGAVIKVTSKVDAIARLKNRIKRKIQEESEQRVLVPRSMFDPIDYSETMAFSNIGTVCGGVQLNVIGRESNGIVLEKDKEKLIQEIKEKLLNIKDPISGETFMKKVCLKEEIYSGQALNKIPDLILIPNDGFYIFNGISEKELFQEASPLSPGNHLSNGIILINGVKTSTINLKSPRIYDLLPTILDLFNLSVPAYVDGKSLLIKKKDKLQELVLD
jgi:predicted AlkP superfamily phosphohydrolase/phosphomutase